MNSIIANYWATSFVVVRSRPRAIPLAMITIRKKSSSRVTPLKCCHFTLLLCRGHKVMYQHLKRTCRLFLLVLVAFSLP